MEWRLCLFFLSDDKVLDEYPASITNDSRPGLGDHAAAISAVLSETQTTLGFSLRINGIVGTILTRMKPCQLILQIPRLTSPVYLTSSSIFDRADNSVGLCLVGRGKGASSTQPIF